MRLAEHPEQEWQNRSHFLSLAAKIMRRILIDHARTRCAAKRGGGRLAVELKVLHLRRAGAGG
jgi:RNA polymerase sigma-70 factor, ECF subfamily